MTANEFRESLICNEPDISYQGKNYSICHPEERYYIFSEDDLAVNDLVFESADDLLDHWILGGKPLREIIPEIDCG